MLGNGAGEWKVTVTELNGDQDRAAGRRRDRDKYRDKYRDREKRGKERKAVRVRRSGWQKSPDSMNRNGALLRLDRVAADTPFSKSSSAPTIDLHGPWGRLPRNCSLTRSPHHDPLVRWTPSVSYLQSSFSVIIANQSRLTWDDYIPLHPLASSRISGFTKTGTLLVFRVFRASENQGFSKYKRSDGFRERETSIDASTKAELTRIFASRGWIVIRALSIVLERINCLVASCTRITCYTLSDTREAY